MFIARGQALIGYLLYKQPKENRRCNEEQGTFTPDIGCYIQNRRLFFKG